jgi:hypothetical protein
MPTSKISTGPKMEDDKTQIGYSARQWAMRLGKKDTTITGWIKRGLRAADVSPPGAKRKTWLILERDMYEFLKNRSPDPQPVPTRRRGRRGKAWQLAKRYFDGVASI